jgi:hypothetical protein
VSSINWHSTVKDHLAQDICGVICGVRTFFTGVKRFIDGPQL